MSGATVASVAIGVGTSLVSGAVSNAISGGGGGGSVQAPASQSGGGSGTGTAPFEGLSAYTNAGVHPAVKPPMGPGDPRESNTGINNVSGQVADEKAPPATKIDPLSAVRKTPTQPNFESNVNKDTNDQWADRLSHYLDYNTRTLG